MSDDTWGRIHDAALTRDKDGGAELARLVVYADDLFQEQTDRIEALEAENARLRETLERNAIISDSWLR